MWCRGFSHRMDTSHGPHQINQRTSGSQLIAGFGVICAASHVLEPPQARRLAGSERFRLGPHTSHRLNDLPD